LPLRIRQTPASALVVSHPSAAQHLSILLSAIGFDNVWSARSIRDALGYCKVTPFDVAIVQLDLGAEDGAHLVTALRAWPGSVDQILAVSLDEQRLHSAADARLPADAFLQMPLTFTALQKVVGHKVRTNRPGLGDDDDAVLIINDDG